MKKFVTLFIVVWFSAACYAEHEYQPFLKQGKKWVTNKYQYLINGDTVVQERTSRTYMKIYQRPATSSDESDWTYFGCAREKNRKVRIIYSTYFTPTVLYDFNCDAQESYICYCRENPISINLYEDFKETTVNEMSLNSARIVFGYKLSKSDIVAMYQYGYGEQWKEQLVDDWMEAEEFNQWAYPQTTYVMMEGIGYLTDPFIPGSNDRLVLCEEDGKIIYGTDTSGINSPRLTTNANQDEIYGLQGRRVNNPRQGGIYIQKGKKVKR
jgi:hypothetical protein